MTSKELINKTLRHKMTNRVPVDFGATMVTGIHVSCVDALNKHFGIENGPVKVIDPYQMLGEVCDQLKEIIGIDVIGVNPKNNMFGFPNEHYKPWHMPNGLEVLVPEKFNTTRDEKGDFYIYPEGDTSAPPSARMPKDSFFFDSIIRQEPIIEERLNPEDNLEEFSEFTPQDVQYFSEEVEKAYRTGRAVVLNIGGTGFGDIALVPAPFLKHPRGIRDIEEWYISTLARPDYIHQVFEKQLEIALKNLEKVSKEVADKVEVLYVCGTDFGTQSGTFLDADTFKSLYHPYYKALNDWVHENTHWKTFKHSCGAVETLIPSFIEAGFDILNPVQVSAAGMEADKLKQKYGHDITFWGGGVDTQQTLPFGKPQEVHDQVKERLDIFSEKGGFVFNTIHNIQANTPVENMLAMFDAIHEFSRR
jgi:hypothetical protein